jgi:site-specific recombinase XerC
VRPPQLIQLQESETTRIAEHIDDVIAALERMPKDFSPNTLRGYRSDLTLAAEALNMPLDQISASDVEHFLTSGGAAPSTAQRRAASLKRFLRWARRERLCSQNPMDLIEAIATIRRLPCPSAAPPSANVSMRRSCRRHNRSGSSSQFSAKPACALTA